MWRNRTVATLALMALMAWPVHGQETKTGVKTIAPATTMQAQKIKPGMRGEVAGVRAGTALPLTTGECTTLGGESVDESVCNSGKACQTRDQNGTWHRVCISKVQ